MRLRIAFAVFAGAMVMAAASFAACPAPALQTQSKSHKAHTPQPGCVDLNGVPQISANIAATAPAPTAKAPAPVDLGNQPYSGPSVGLTKLDPGVKPVPTVGYHWSID